jgi:hypothetical protein
VPGSTVCPRPSLSSRNVGDLEPVQCIATGGERLTRSSQDLMSQRRVTDYDPARIQTEDVAMLGLAGRQEPGRIALIRIARRETPAATWYSAVRFRCRRSLRSAAFGVENVHVIGAPNVAEQRANNTPRPGHQHLPVAESVIRNKVRPLCRTSN